MRITSRIVPRVIGLDINLSYDEMGNLSVALADYVRLMKQHRNLSGGTSWPWIEEFLKELDKARG